MTGADTEREDQEGSSELSLEEGLESEEVSPEGEEPPVVHQIRPPGGEAVGALVLFHGRGTDEHDMFPLFDILDPSYRLVGVAPRGPLELPPNGSQWYLLADGNPDAESFLTTVALIEGWLDELAVELAIPLERMVLGGFSSGAAIAYAVGLRRGRPQPAGLMAFSGFLPDLEGLDLDLDDRSSLPVAISHGILDTVIRPEHGREARRRLEEAGASVVYRDARYAHAIDPRFLYALQPWISQALEQASGEAGGGQASDAGGG